MGIFCIIPCPHDSPGHCSVSCESFKGFLNASVFCCLSARLQESLQGTMHRRTTELLCLVQLCVARRQLHLTVIMTRDTNTRPSIYRDHGLYPSLYPHQISPSLYPSLSCFLHSFLSSFSCCSSSALLSSLQPSFSTSVFLCVPVGIALLVESSEAWCGRRIALICLDRDDLN